MPPEPEALVVLCTCPDESVAQGIATALIADDLAACVNLVPGIRSIYRWDGQIRVECEVLLVMKTTAARYSALEATVEALHPYDVPEIIALPVTAGARSYLGWIRQATGG